MKPLKCYKKRFIEYRLMTRLDDKEISVASAFDCLDDIKEDHASAGKYSRGLLDALVAVGALTKEYTDYYHANDNTQKWIDALLNAYYKKKEKK